MNKEERKAFKVINTRTRRLLDELEIEKEDMSDEPKIAYLMQEIRANKTILNLIEKLQKENELAKKQVEYDKTHIYTPQTIKLNYILIQKIKDKIKTLEKLQNEFLNNEELRVKIIAYKELIEERSDIYENM